MVKESVSPAPAPTELGVTYPISQANNGLATDHSGRASAGNYAEILRNAILSAQDDFRSAQEQRQSAPASVNKVALPRYMPGSGFQSMEQ